ncbi:MAG: tRNA uracil 4-sulfurtransferase ThiI [Longimicrobiales bacterium]
MTSTAGSGAAGSEAPLYLVRLSGEMAIKSRRTRSHFQRRLVRNLRDALTTTDSSFVVEDVWTRLHVRSAAPDAGEVIARVFGVSSLSRVEAEVPAELDAIVEAGRALFAERVRGRRYAVRARRSGSHAFSTPDIEVRLGTALNPGALVDLDDPEITVRVEVRDQRAFLFADRRAGPGGLPLGVEGRALALLSGAFDSGGAARLLATRGVAIDYVFCNLGGDAYERAVVQVAKLLADEWSYGTRPRLHVIDFEKPLAALRASVRERYWQVVLKRMMYRAACRIGLGDVAAIVTGEALGQVSSQTLDNLRAIEPASDLPVFRPLVGFDKEEIIARARQIGTAALSEQVREYCAIAPGRPVTAASVAAVDAQEAALDPAVLERAVAGRKILDLRALSGVDLVAPYIFTTEIDDDAVVIDTRPASAFAAWHWPGATQHDEWDLLREFRRLDKAPRYVLYCTHGVQSAHLAERMQRHGYEAYSFKGGVRGVMRLAESRRPEAGG